MEPTVTTKPEENTWSEAPEFLDLVTLEPLGDRVEFTITPGGSY